MHTEAVRAGAKAAAIACVVSTIPTVSIIIFIIIINNAATLSAN